MSKSNWSRVRLFGGFIQITSSDLFRFHLRIGPLALYLESGQLYALSKKQRKREQPKVDH